MFFRVLIKILNRGTSFYLLIIILVFPIFLQEGRKLGYGAMQGIPMIASSPVRHDSPLNLQGIDVQTYQPPWKALSDFALHADLDSNGAINTHTPAFQQLVNQVGFSKCHEVFYKAFSCHYELLICHEFVSICNNLK